MKNRNPNTGHGHVYPRSDGLLFRCGGPSYCKQCARDAERKKREAERKKREDKTPEEEPQILSVTINNISDGMTKLLASGLNRKAVVVLLADASKVGRPDINKVLDALTDLKRQYCE